MRCPHGMLHGSGDITVTCHLHTFSPLSMLATGDHHWILNSTTGSGCALCMLNSVVQLLASSECTCGQVQCCAGTWLVYRRRVLFAVSGYSLSTSCQSSYICMLHVLVTLRLICRSFTRRAQLLWLICPSIHCASSVVACTLL